MNPAPRPLDSEAIAMTPNPATTAPSHVVIDGQVVVDDALLVSDGLEDRLTRHGAVARRMQGV